MKNYFKFNLTGQKLLPIWLLLLVFFMVPYLFVIVKMQDIQHLQSNPENVFGPLISKFQIYGIMFLLIIIEYIFIFYIAKMSINHTEFNGLKLSFSGGFGEFFGKFLLGMFLSIITFGIYFPWFIASIYAFFAKYTRYKSEDFVFKGKGIDLFTIILLTLVLPMVVIMIGMVSFALTSNLQADEVGPMTAVMPGIMTLFIFVLMIPYMYYIYKWMVNLGYKEYEIKWETSFWPSAGVIVSQILLSIITLGVYLPLASLKMFAYFSDKTIATSDITVKRFGYEIEPLSDFLFIWGQTLLTMITLGIYYPWAYCKIISRIASKTFIKV